MAIFNYYDIESLENLFTLCNYREKEEELEVYYLLDSSPFVLSDDFYDKCKKEIYEKNKNFKGKIKFFNLSTIKGNKHLAKRFGLTEKELFYDESKNVPYRLISDYEEEYDDDKHPYFVGYNSKNYDTTMLAQYFYESYFSNMVNNKFSKKSFENVGPKASSLRDFNNILFNNSEIKSYMPKALMYDMSDLLPQGANDYNLHFLKQNWNNPQNRLRNAWIKSGRYIDVANLNEQQSKVGLKKILATLGYQILESNKLKSGQDYINSEKEMIEVLAYNASDVINLKYLMHHDSYMSTFKLKKNLLKTYPSLVYEKKDDSYDPNIDPNHVRKNRMVADDTSSKLASYIVCPYGRLSDIETVSFKYPSDRAMREIEKQNESLPKEKQINIKQINVLDYVERFFNKNIKSKDAQKHFKKIVNYYKKFENQNFNDSKEYKEDYPNGPSFIKESSINSGDLIIPYYTKDGEPTSCYVNFSIGGAHGGEYYLAKYKYDLYLHKKECERIKEVREKYDNVLDFRKMVRVTLSDGKEYKTQSFLKSGTRVSDLEKNTNDYNKTHFWKKYPKKPSLTIKQNKTYKIKPKYVYTSLGHVIHQDFKSYYPNLLRMLAAFLNHMLGKDIYGEIYYKKEEYGLKIKQVEKYSKEERNIFEILRAGVKLILNSVTGKADSNFYSPIRMNNMIISMRVIGQLFTYLVAQTQALDSTKIISTNTDGLYSKASSLLLDDDENLKEKLKIKEKRTKIAENTLKDLSKIINVDIEPEKLFLISKDSNNRIELDEKRQNIISAGGGNLACFDDTNPKKALDHPAIVDYALAEYLICIAHKLKGVSLDKKLDKDIARNIFKNAKKRFSPQHLLRMYQNIISNTDIAYVFAYNNDKHTEDNPYILQKYNRVFYVKDDIKDSYFLKIAEARKISDRDLKKRRKNNEPELSDDPKALNILKKYNVDYQNMIKENREAQFKKVSKIGLDWHVLIKNDAINFYSDKKANKLLEKLDIEKYISLLEDTFNNNWMNKIDKKAEEYYERIF